MLRLPHKHLVIYLAILLAGVFSMPLSGANFTNVEMAPEELMLNSNEKKAASALTNYAWGFFLRIEGLDTWDESFDYFSRALEKDPHSPAVREQVLSPILVSKDYPRMINALTPVVDKNPEVLDLHFVLIEALRETGKNDEAKARLNELLERTNFSNPRIIRELFVYYWKSNEFSQADKLLKKSLPKHKDSFILNHIAALYYNNLGSEEKNDKKKKQYAEKSFKYARLAASHIDQCEHERDVNGLVHILSKNKDYDTLVRMFESIQLNTKLTSPHFSMLLADALIKKGKVKRAQVILNGTGKNPDTPPGMLPEIGEMLLKTGDLQGAAIMIEKTIMVYPDAKRLEYQLAYIRFQLGEFNKVISILKKYDNLPTLTELLRAYALNALHMNNEALKSFLKIDNASTKKGSKFKPDMQFYLTVATLYEEEKDFDASIKYARKAYNMDKTNAMAANFLGYILADHDRELTEAEELINLAIAKEPENYAYLDSLAWVLYRQKRYPEAMTAIMAALRNSGKDQDSVILDHAGDICLALKYNKLALMYWQDALIFEADKDSIIEKINALKYLTGKDINE